MQIWRNTGQFNMKIDILLTLIICCCICNHYLCCSYFEWLH